MKKQLLSFLLVLITFGISAQSIVVNDPGDPETALSAEDLLRDVLINGSSCVDVTLTNLADNPDGTADPNQRSWGYFRNGGGSFPFEEGIILSSGFAVNAQGPNDQGGSSDVGTNWLGDPDIQAILDNFTGTSFPTNNATVFEFTFTSAVDQVDFEFIFASEEYENDFECDDDFRDGFAFLVSGPGIPDDSGAPFGGTNIASIVGSDNVPVSTLSIHADTFPICGTEVEGVNFFPELYVSNQDGNNNNEIQFDGRTVALTTATVDVIPDEIYTVKLVIADRGDSSFDSAVFLNAGSFNIGDADLGDDVLISSGNAVCEGNTITLDATTEDAVAYAWFLDGTVLPAEINPTLDVTTAGTYTVEVQIALGNGEVCVLTDEIVIQFINTEAVDAGDDIIACEGDTVTIDTNVASINTLISWFQDGVILTGETSSTLDVTVSGTYTIQVEFGGDPDCVFTDEIVVDFLPTPEIELGTNIESCLADVTTLDATPSNIDPTTATYQWTLDGIVIPTATMPTLDITALGTYEVTVSVGTCTAVDTITVTAPDVTADLGDDFNTCFVMPETLTATLTNLDTADATFEWSLDGTVLTGETDPTLDIDMPGTYMVTVTSGVCTATDTIIVTQANDDGTECVEGGDGCDIIDAGPDQTVTCDNQTATITATLLGLPSTLTLPLTETTDYIVGQVDCPLPPLEGMPTNLTIDDNWSDVINLPFTFSFYGNDYTALTVGANGQISFDLTLAGNFNDWNSDVGQLIPVNDPGTFPLNTIYGAFHDIDPSVNQDPNEINFFISGDAPFRTFVLNFNAVPQFSCNDLLTTQQIILYESFNIVDVNIIEKPVCDAWNDGLATLGFMGNDLTEFIVPPGRNTDNWAASNEFWRFLPAGEIDDDNILFEWRDDEGNLVSNDLTTMVSPVETTTYTATIFILDDAGNVIGSASDDVTIFADVIDFTVDLGGDLSFCDVDSYEIIPELAGDVTDPTFLWSTGETTETIVVTETGTYSVEVTVEGCTMTDEITITFFTSPDCFVEPDCFFLDFVEDFGTGTGRVTTPFTNLIFNGTGQINDGEYAITNISDGLNTGWHQGMEDNTEGDVDGRALFVNADFTPAEFYRRSIDLLPDSDYTFAAFITTVYDTDTFICPGTGNPSNVIFRIEDTAGNTIAEVETGDIQNEADPNWQQFSIDFNSASNTTIQLVLINNAPGGCGNDLAIDDLSLGINDASPPIATPDDLVLCDDLNDGVEIFDLTAQIPAVLDGLDPSQFEVSFHTTQLDAEANTSPIATPDAYANIGNPETIYVRVQVGAQTECFSIVNFDLILNAVIDIMNDLPATLDVCSNVPFPSLDATPTNGGIDLSQVTYLWTNAAGDTVSTDAVFTPAQSGTFTVVVDLPPCSQATFTVDVLITDPPIVDLGPDELVCDGDSFEIIPALGGNLDGATFLWSTGETTESIVVNQSGTFTLTVTVGPCAISDDIVITIAAPVNVSIREDFTTCREFEEVFIATTDTPGATFEWFIEGVSQGETSSTFTTSFPLGTPSGQEVTVVVTNADGCTGEASTIVSFFEIDQCVIPEGISPGTTIGFNDRLDLEFLAARTGIETIYIYNRLGTLVFEQDNYVNQWEGQSEDGDILPTATYFYVIDFTGNDPVYGNQATGWVYVNREN